MSYSTRTTTPGAFHCTEDFGVDPSQFAGNAVVEPIAKQDKAPQKLKQEQAADVSKPSKGRWVWPTVLAGSILTIIAIGGGVGFAIASKNKSTSETVPGASTTQDNADRCSLSKIEESCAEGLIVTAEDLPGCIQEKLDGIQGKLSPQLQNQDNVFDSCAPDKMATLKLAEFENVLDLDTLSVLQRYILYTLYYHMNGHVWADDGGIFETEDECDIEFVDCNESGEIESLNLGINQVHGTIPSTIGLLSNIKRLDMSENSIQGTLPTQIGDLSELEFLNLGGNNLSGTLASELGSLKELIYLDIEQNNFVGPVSDALGGLESLETLFVRDVYLGGSFPRAFSQLSNLKILGTSFCGFEGTLPDDIAANWGQLKVFDVGGNSLIGSLPRD